MSTSIEAAEPAAPSTRALFFTVFPSIMLPMFMASVDQTIVATALPAIAASMGEVGRVSWVVVSYLVATTIAAPVYGRLGDALGRKRLLFVALGVFMLASILCAAAPNILCLVAARLLQGVGGGGLMTLSQALVGEAVPPRERGRYQGYLAAVFVSSSTFGPVAGGWLTQQFGWQSVFTVNLPLGVAAVLLALRLPSRAGSGGKLRFDTLGMVLFAGFVAPLVLALERLQSMTTATAPAAAGFTGLSLLCLWGLLRQERRAATPLLPLALLRHGAIWRCDLLAACVGATLVSMVTFIPIYLQVVRGTGPSETGLLMLPMTAGIAVGALITGRIIARTGRTAIVPSFGLLVTVGCLLVLALSAGRIPLRGLIALFAVYALSLGTAMTVVQTTVLQVAGAANLGAGSASVQFSRSVGAAFGASIVSCVLFAVIGHADAQTAALFAELVEAGPAALRGLDAARQAVVASEIADAFRAAFLTIACFIGVGLVMAWTIPVRRV